MQCFLGKYRLFMLQDTIRLVGSMYIPANKAAYSLVGICRSFRSEWFDLWEPRGKCKIHYRDPRSTDPKPLSPSDIAHSHISIPMISCRYWYCVPAWLSYTVYLLFHSRNHTTQDRGTKQKSAHNYLKSDQQWDLTIVFNHCSAVIGYRLWVRYPRLLLHTRI